VSSAIDVATAVGWCPIECLYVQWLLTADGLRQWLLTADGLRQDAVRAMVTADGLRRDAVRVMVTADLQQMEHTHRGCVETCMLGKTPSTP